MVCVFKARVLVAHGCFNLIAELQNVQALESGLTEAEAKAGYAYVYGSTASNTIEILH